MTEQNEFKALGLTMTAMTIGYGILLILWGLTFVYISGAPNAEGVVEYKFTAGIPAVIGLPILLAGFLAKIAPAKKKVWMHIAVLFGLFCFLGGIAMIVKAAGSPDGLFSNARKASSFIMMGTTGFVFTLSCVRSFIWARRNPQSLA